MNWKRLPLEVPDNLQLCWIRINFFYGTPFVGTWHEADQHFVSDMTKIIYPAWTVARWRAL